MKALKILGTILLIASLWSCSTEDEIIDDFSFGKNDYTIEVDGDSREYIVHVPTGYNINEPTPVVFMLHAASSTGPKVYNNSGWSLVGEDENILTVYPTSWSYCYTNKNTGLEFNQPVWNSFRNQFIFCPEENPRDDIKFLRQVVKELNQKFNVDNQKIYVVGFSSGAQMAYRCAAEMSDIFAAVVESGASQYQDTLVSPSNKMPITFQIGNADNAFLDGMPPVPLMYFDSLLNNYSTFKNLIRNHVTYFDFEPTYEITGDPEIALIATYKGIPDTANRHFRFIFIKGLEHKYPNGFNHPIKGAEENWKWLKQFELN